MGPDMPDNENVRMIPLHTAAAHGFLEGVELLLAAGADINRRNALGDTPLFLNASHSRYYHLDIFPPSPEIRGRLDETFLLLHRNGAVITAPYRLCRYAAWYGHAGTVDFLLRTVFEQYPETPPDRTRDVEMSPGSLQFYGDESLFEYYPELAQQNQSILYAAVCSGKIDLVRSLIDFGAAGFAGKDGGESLLRAVRDNHPDIAMALLESGAPTAPLLHGAKPGARLRMDPGRLAAKLWMQNRNEKEVKHGGYFPGEESFQRSLTGAVEQYPDDLRPLIPMVGTGFMLAVLRGIREIYLSDEENAEKEFKESIRQSLALYFNEKKNKYGMDPNYYELLKAREKDVRALVKRGSCHVTEPRALAEVLDEFHDVLLSTHPGLPGLFLPGIARENLRLEWKSGKYPIHTDIPELYGRFGGTEEGGEEILGGYDLLSPEAAVRQRMAEFSPPYHFLIMQNVFGCTVQMELRQDARFYGLIYETDIDGYDNPCVYPHLAAFFGAAIACFREGVYWIEKVESSEGGSDALVIDFEWRHRIFQRYTLRAEKVEAHNMRPLAAMRHFDRGASKLESRTSVTL